MERRQPVRLSPFIVIDKGEQRRTAYSHAAVAGAGDAGHRLDVIGNRQTASETAGDSPGRAGRIIVDDDDVKGWRTTLRGKRFQQALEACWTIAGGNANADFGHREIASPGTPYSRPTN